MQLDSAGILGIHNPDRCLDWLFVYKLCAASDEEQTLNNSTESAYSFKSTGAGRRKTSYGTKGGEQAISCVPTVGDMLKAA